ncbi:hypothetical protein PoB_000737700 [Plakobranchus ocellatus]|uniref:Uncharacterized protein n=1 Tax=Plakobranchus ocellatus TaxID=259542 RepID=A0AAV3YFE0_9GAST|nr:hypothetical protein PoB_000737700 [Plakobranchus ocellatus]
MEIINLDDPSTLRRLIATDTASSSTSSLIAPSPEPPFISEFSTTSEDSDIENEEEEFVAVRSKHVAPTYRQLLHDDIEEDDNHDEEEGRRRRRLLLFGEREQLHQPFFISQGQLGCRCKWKERHPLITFS